MSSKRPKSNKVQKQKKAKALTASLDIAVRSLTGLRLTAVLALITLLSLSVFNGVWITYLATFVLIAWVILFAFRIKLHKPIWSGLKFLNNWRAKHLTRKLFIGVAIGYCLALLSWPQLLQPTYKNMVRSIAPSNEVLSIEGGNGYSYSVDDGYQPCANNHYQDCDGFRLNYSNTIDIFFKNKVSFLSRWSLDYSISPEYETEAKWDKQKRHLLISPTKLYYHLPWAERARFEYNQTYSLRLTMDSSSEPLEVIFCLLPEDSNSVQDKRVCPNHTSTE